MRFVSVCFDDDKKLLPCFEYNTRPPYLCHLSNNAHTTSLPAHRGARSMAFQDETTKKPALLC
jgi:hypothetical protein